MSKRILGLDLSLTATGWALVWDGSPKWGVIKSRNRSVKRLSEIRNAVLDIINQTQPSLAVIEGYSYGSSHGMAGLAELGGVIRLLLLDMGIPFIVVAPATNKKFATGKGNAEKDLMLKRVFQHWAADMSNNNEADAFALAQFGRCYLNQEGFCDYQTKTVETYKRKELGK
jgi:Holliday junction resolvasome RuvABC endonuclease subunit|nr:MAG TPA: RuvC [Caudoviricetes sp.]